MEGLLWTLKSKGFDAAHDGRLLITIPSTMLGGWLWMVDHLNNSYNGVFAARVEDMETDEVHRLVLSTIATGMAEDKVFEILRRAVEMDEYKVYPCRTSTVFDLKLGVSCNNNCVHCVIKPQVHLLKERNPEAVVVDSGFGMQCSLDMSYDQVISALECQAPKECRYVITGGEPTFRSDLVHILKWIYYNRPTSRVSVQTNGRNLSDMNLVRGIYRFTREPSFVVAVHGTEAVHNKIVNNRKDAGNPYQETVAGIRNLLQFYSSKRIRTEMVLTKLNIGCLEESIRYQHEQLGIVSTGVSFPHLDGFPEPAVKGLVPDYESIRQLFARLNEYTKEHKDLCLRFEEVPVCVYNDLGAEIHLFSFELRCRSNTSVSFMGNYLQDFNGRWVADHAKFDKCTECILSGECLGTWKESREINEAHVRPIRIMTPHLEHFLARNWGQGGQTK